MTIQAQTNVSYLKEQVLLSMYKSRVAPLPLMRFRDEAKKLLNTHEPFWAYVFLGMLAALDSSESPEGRLKNVQAEFDKARKLPGDAYSLEANYFNCLVYLNMPQHGYEVLEKIVGLSKDNPGQLKSCLQWARFTGQMALAENIISSLDKMGEDMSEEKDIIRALSSVASEVHLRGLMAQIGKVLNRSGIHQWGSSLSIDNDNGVETYFFTVSALPASDWEAVADCDIELSRMQARYALENGLDLSKLVIACDKQELPA